MYNCWCNQCEKQKLFMLLTYTSDEAKEIYKNIILRNIVSSFTQFLETFDNHLKP